MENLKREMQSAFNNLADLYLQALETGLFIPGRDANRDAAEALLYDDHFRDPVIRAEYDQYLAEQEALHPVRDPLPEDYGLDADGLGPER